MRPISILSCLLVVLPALAAEPAAAPDAAAAADAASTGVRERSSYGLGYRTGRQFREHWGNFGIRPEDLEPEVFLKGFLDAFQDLEPEVAESQFGPALQALGDLLQEREQEIAAANLEEGEAFLAANGSREGVVTTASGLQYEVLEPADGERYVKPPEGQPDKRFVVRFTGSLLDGTVFDTTGDETMSIELDVIPGLREALEQMPVGATWKLVIPPQLGYGDTRRSAEIGPNCTLVFELELVAIEDSPGLPEGLGFPLPVGD